MARRKKAAEPPPKPRPVYEVRLKQFGRSKRYLVIPVYPDGTEGRPQSAVDDEAQATGLAARFNDASYTGHCP